MAGRRGSKRILLRGDTDFTQSKELDRWDENGPIEFIFGIDAMPNLVEYTDKLLAGIGVRSPGSTARPSTKCKTEPRQRPENVKEQVVRQREFENIRLVIRAGGLRVLLSADRLRGKLYRIVVVAARTCRSIQGRGEVLFDDVKSLLLLHQQRLGHAGRGDRAARPMTGATRKI